MENYPTRMSWTGNHVFLGYDLGHIKRFCEIRGQRGIFSPPVLNLEICISVVMAEGCDGFSGTYAIVVPFAGFVGVSLAGWLEHA